MRRVYIDEAGDRGTTMGSSRYFVVAALIVDEQKDATARQELQLLKQALGRKSTDTLHFRKLTHPQKVKACQEISTFSVQTFTSVIVCKRTISTPFPGGGLAYISQPDPMYLWAIRLLLERVSWFIRDTCGGSCTVTFAHLKRFKAAKLHSYREALLYTPTSIHWPSFAGHRFRLDAPNAIAMLQVADVCASAVFRAVEPDQYGNREPRYLTELRPIVYRRPGSAVTSYGLKVFPPSEADPGGSVSYLRQF